MYVYPKVKVRQHKEEKDDQHALLHLSSPVKDQVVFPATTARVPISYEPLVVVPSIPVVEGVREANKIEEMNKQNIRAGSIPPPRAVLSSPDNDIMIGQKNKIKARQPSALKKHSVVQDRSSQNFTANSVTAKGSKGTLVENSLNEKKGSASKLMSQKQPPRTRRVTFKEK